MPNFSLIAYLLFWLSTYKLDTSNISFRKNCVHIRNTMEKERLIFSCTALSSIFHLIFIKEHAFWKCKELIKNYSHIDLNAIKKKNEKCFPIIEQSVAQDRHCGNCFILNSLDNIWRKEMLL